MAEQTLKQTLKLSKIAINNPEIIKTIQNDHCAAFGGAQGRFAPPEWSFCIFIY